MDEMQAVLTALRVSPRKMTPDEIVAATGLDATAVDRALQALLLRRLVMCHSYRPPGRGGQAGMHRVVGQNHLPLWTAVLDRA